jgi:hypothetical protein
MGTCGDGELWGWTAEKGQLDRTACKGQAEQDRRDRTEGTGQMGQDRQGRRDKLDSRNYTDTVGQEREDVTART